MDGLEDALRHLRVSHSTVVAIDTEGTTRTGGIREIAAVVLGSDDGAAFYDIVTRSESGSAAPLDARRTWATVGARFWAWIASVAPADGSGDVICVMHNGKRHDVPLIERDTRLHCPEALPQSLRLRVVDSLDLVRKHLVHLKKRDQASVYEALFGAPPAKSHTALADARALASILLHESLYTHIIPESTPWRIPLHRK